MAGRPVETPVFLRDPASTQALEGDSVTVTCEVTADPAPEVIWRRDSVSTRTPRAKY